jgi:hypothetical protein
VLIRVYTSNLPRPQNKKVYIKYAEIKKVPSQNILCHNISTRSALYSSRGFLLFVSVTFEIIHCKCSAKLRLLFKSIQIISHPVKVPQSLPIGRSILLPIKPSRLLIQEENIAVWTAKWRWRRSNVVGDERLTRLQGWRSICGGSCLQTRLDPMENRT